MIITNAVSAFADWAWGIPMLIWLVGGGIILTIAIGGLQFRRLGFVIRQTLIKSIKDKTKTGNITSFQSVLAALSGTIGTGNIVGVGAAIALGGPGAIFWMWVVGCVAMGIKYCEVLSSQKFREPAEDGHGYLWNAGPVMYLKKGLGIKGLGAVMSFCYAIVATWALIMSAPEHTSAITDVLGHAYGVPKLASIIVCVIIVAAVMLGGMKRFVKASEFCVPIMSIVYIVFGLVVILVNFTNIPHAIASIFAGAFTGTSAVGGFAGAGISQALRWGTARGMYSSDAGTGISSIMHGQAECEHPAQQGLYGVLEVFVDTIIVCTFTALVILCTGVWETGAEGSSLALSAFGSALGGVGTFVAVASLVLFAITSAIGMAIFMERQAHMLWGKYVARTLQVIYLVLMVAGGYVGFDAVLPYTDMSCALEIFINMTGLVIMVAGIRATTKDYFENFLPSKGIQLKRKG